MGILTEHEWTLEHASENVTTRPYKLEEPYALDEPARIFVNSISDLFHSHISDEYIREVFAVMRNCLHHVFQILTKRPGRAAHMELEWPPNVWIDTSVEDDRVADRIQLLSGCDADVLFISFEPLIGPVGEVDLSSIDWAIGGGESGPNGVRREMDHEWARDILRQFRRDYVAFFFKQSSARQPERGTRLTIKNEEHGVYEQRKIREVPEPHEAVQWARDAFEIETKT